MDHVHVFEKHRVKPGDEGFKYAGEVHFENEKNVLGWDSDDDYSDSDFRPDCYCGQASRCNRKYVSPKICPRPNFRINMASGASRAGGRGGGGGERTNLNLRQTSVFNICQTAFRC